MDIQEALTHVNESIQLRKPDQAKIAEYGEKMKAGVTFPPIVVGTWPHSEKYGSSGIVDGIHRLGGAVFAEHKSIEVTTKKFNTLGEALAYMYAANMEHGLPVKEGDRNKRIKLLKQIDSKLTLEQIGKQFGLHPSSVDRILKGTQGEGKSGPKGGATASKAHKSQQPKKASALYKSIEALNIEFARKRPNQLVELGAYLSPATEEHPDGELDVDKLQELEILANHLKNLIKELK